MKKFTKIWILTLALFVLTASLFAKAASKVEKKTVSLTLTQWSNSCTIENYAFGTKDASYSAIPLWEMTGAITCTFLENTWTTISLWLTNLTGGGNTIPYTWFQFKVAAANASWAISNLTEKPYTTFTQANIDIYTKAPNKLWYWSSVLTLSWTIPAWTAWWTYQGELNLTIQ